MVYPASIQNVQQYSAFVVGVLSLAHTHTHTHTHTHRHTHTHTGTHTHTHTHRHTLTAGLTLRPGSALSLVTSTDRR